MSALFSPIWGLPAAVFSIFTASTGLRLSVAAPVNGWAGGGVGSGGACVCDSEAACGGAAAGSSDEQAAGASNAPPARTTQANRVKRTAKLLPMLRKLGRSLLTLTYFSVVNVFGGSSSISKNCGNSV